MTHLVSCYGNCGTVSRKRRVQVVLQHPNTPKITRRTWWTLHTHTHWWRQSWHARCWLESPGAAWCWIKLNLAKVLDEKCNGYLFNRFCCMPPINSAPASLPPSLSLTKTQCLIVITIQAATLNLNIKYTKCQCQQLCTLAGSSFWFYILLLILCCYSEGAVQTFMCWWS